jgi:hypothetical protein
MCSPKSHRRRCVAENIAHHGERYAAHYEPGRKGMAEVMEVEIRQSCGRTGPTKAMSHVVPPNARQNCGMFLFPNITGGHSFLVTF